MYVCLHPTARLCMRKPRSNSAQLYSCVELSGLKKHVLFAPIKLTNIAMHSLKVVVIMHLTVCAQSYLVPSPYLYIYTVKK